MKELSIEEKAKRYDNVVGKLKQFMTQGVDPLITKADVQDFFPELKESEDERMKNAAIKACKYMIDNFENSTKDYEDAIAWLEKQKTSEEALQYLRENHSSSEMSDFQAAMNIAVAKAYDKGYNDGLEKHGEQKPAEWSEEDEQYLLVCKNALYKYQSSDQWDAGIIIRWLLNKLKCPVFQQPKQEWSEEDENHIQHISDFIMRNRVGDTDAIYRLEQDVNWLRCKLAQIPQK